MEALWIAVGTFGLVWSTVFLFLAPRTVRPGEVVARRMQALEATGHSPLVLRGGPTASVWERLATFFFGEDELAKRTSGLRRLLHQAGFPGERAARVLLGVRVLLAIALAGAVFLVGTLSAAGFSRLLTAIGAAAAIGWLVPLLHVRRKARLRRRELEETFPDTLDLLVVCVEGGLGVEAALQHVGAEQAARGLAIGDEILLMMREMGAGIPRREALGRMSERLDSDYLRSLTGFLIQTEEMGGSIARSLRVYAESMRQKRRQRAEEAVRKMVIRLLLPLALLIMPSLFLVIFAPPVINIMRFLVLPGR